MQQAVTDFFEKSLLMKNVLIDALFETLTMSLISTFLATLIGFILAIVLIMTDKNGVSPNAYAYKFLDVSINMLRSFPFIILIIVLFPVTKFLVGKHTGTFAMIVPLTIGTAPFIARMIEGAFKEVDRSVVEAAQSFGANKFQIIFRVLLPEAFPSIISAITLSLIIIIGFSAMAGTVGGGGLGAVAMNYGYYRFDAIYIFWTVFILIVLVQIFQSFGDILYKIVKH
ncbi:methionine ABC transporter permease [Sulfurospirillum barnesii]|uniref:ABC-type metal ion transport system, permease component n=1 Tax=Sulfurospirillum barnesii (strain ATCC 700032 / DSM 10660 / SES-3) TaxID=760154 RepID=I3XUT9_SULBS|nr:methionine ABC transporter permease [Sulfurospirillum barnesii]AFL67713.1 ABC-type metal ion transport system, permease component [Sulfurospirillum barnesii SES-3]